MEEGWFLISRKEDCLYFEEKFTRWQAWQDLIRIASYKETYSHIRGIMIKHEIGNIYESQEKLATRWKWSRGKVNRFLEELKSMGRIEMKKNSVVTCITISNYSKYQIKCEKNEQKMNEKMNEKWYNRQYNKNSGINNYESTLYTTDDTTDDTTNDTTLKESKRKKKKDIERKTTKKEKTAEAVDAEIIQPIFCNEFIANEKVSDTLKSFGRWFNEQTIMNLHNCGHDIRGEDELFALFDEFQTHTIASGIEIRDEKQLKRHFANWARIRLKSKPKEDNDNQNIGPQLRNLITKLFPEK